MYICEIYCWQKASIYVFYAERDWTQVVSSRYSRISVPTQRDNTAAYESGKIVAAIGPHEPIRGPLCCITATAQSGLLFWGSKQVQSHLAMPDGQDSLNLVRDSKYSQEIRGSKLISR
jgi:hypothetical protein